MIPSLWHSAQLYKDFFSSIAVGGFITGEAGVDKTDELIDKINDLQGTGKALVISGLTQFSSNLPNLDGSYLVGTPGSVLEAQAKSNMSIGITGSGPSGIIGLEIRNRTMRRYRISAISQVGGAGTAVTITLLAADLADPVLGAHDFVIGDTLYVQNIVMTAGTINGIALTVASVTTTTVTFAAIAVRDIADTTVYPYDRLDGHGRTIYPVVYRSRSATFTDTLVDVLNATNFTIRGCYFRWSPVNGLSIRVSSRGVVEDTKIQQTAADGLHITGMSSDLSLRRIEVAETGDDGVAVVSYKQNGGSCSRLFMEDIWVRDMWFHGRGLAILGGQDIEVNRARVVDVYGAGIMIAYDNTYGTYGCRGVTVRGFSIKTAGNSGTVPIGWGTNVNSALYFVGGAGTKQSEVRDIEVGNGRIYNSRYRGIGNTTAYLKATIHDIEVVETEGSGCDGLPLNDGRMDRVGFERARFHGLVLVSEANLGVTKYQDLTITDCNRGTRLFIQSANVTAGVVTFTLEPGTTHSLIATSSIVANWLASSYASPSSEETEVAKDYALNTYWVLTAVTADAAGDILTVTASAWVTATAYVKGDYRSNAGSNYVCMVAHTSGVFATDQASGYWRTISNTTHVRTRTPEQIHPHAYVCLSSGESGQIRGLNIDTDGLLGKVVFDTINFPSQIWPLQYTAFNNGADARRFLIKNIICLDNETTFGPSEAIYERPTELHGTVISADSNQTIAIEYIRRGVYPRTGLTVGRSDTLPTAQLIVSSQLYASASRVFLFRVKNFSAQILTLLAGTGINLTGTVTIAATTTATYFVLITNATPGAEAVTITRVDSQSGLGA